MPDPFRILAINPGATSTKLGLFEDERELRRTILSHPDAELAAWPRAADQVQLRKAALAAFLRDSGAHAVGLDAVVGRGGLLRPLASGTYRVDSVMLSELRAAERGDHASNLGALLAHEVGEELGAPAFIVDPVCVDELAPVARVSGLAGIERESISHALNTKAVARRFAKERGRPYPDLRLVVAHLGTGVSVSAHRDGRMIDVNNPRDEGPLSPDRPGTLPTRALVDRCFRSGAQPEEVYRELFGSGGIFSYLGTRDLREARARAQAGDGLAALVLEAMTYQIAKAVGEMATVLLGRVDAIILTGGMANDPILIKELKSRVGFLAEVVVYEGEDELAALAQGALRVLRGEEPAHRYGRAGEDDGMLL
ncbi:MAG: butyrate kinase [Polyangia bacterium]|nr:butyrate kinase [Polyangia bacterium]